MTTLMIKDLADAEAGIRELSGTQRRRTTGGMKWQKGTSNSDVVDARGGSIVIFGLIATFDIDGNLSSVQPS